MTIVFYHSAIHGLGFLIYMLNKYYYYRVQVTIQRGFHSRALKTVVVMSQQPLFTLILANYTQCVLASW